MVLEAIKYSRGQLALLEQRKLPQETEWIDIRNTEDGWKAIREMTVRGAPAIAISGALSLAVELVREGNGSQFESAKSAEEHVKERLQYLETRWVCMLWFCGWMWCLIAEVLWIGGELWFGMLKVDVTVWWFTTLDCLGFLHDTKHGSYLSWK